MDPRSQKVKQAMQWKFLKELPGISKTMNRRQKVKAGAVKCENGKNRYAAFTFL